MKKFNGKRLLILGGAHMHVKLIKAAHDLGAYVIVTDYLKDSPAKRIADKAYQINITDIDAIVEMCKKEHIDGVLSAYIDPCQRPYFKVCEALGLPCFGTWEQFFTLTDKHAFKDFCVENGVDIVPEYKEEQFLGSKEDPSIIYPVFVKPVDSRGSRGQSVCYNKNEVIKAIEFAKKESSNGDVLIERYMKNHSEFQVTYFFIDGVPHLLRTADRHVGPQELKLEKVSVCTLSPSIHTNNYLNNAHEKVAKMFVNLGIKNGPVFMQGFVDGDKFRFFDPGLRFPGGEYENIFLEVFGISIMEAIVEFALTGKMPKIQLPADSVLIKGKRIALLFPTIRGGKITKIIGKDTILQKKGIISMQQRHYEGEVVPYCYDVNQRFSEIDLVAQDTLDLRAKIQFIYDNLLVMDEHNEDMMFGKIDTSSIQDCIVDDETKNKYLQEN